MKYYLLLFFCITITSYSQNFYHQMISSQGKSTILSNGLFVSQTTGQQSVIGNSTKKGYTTSQGYQQNLWGKYISSSIISKITTTTYPNPFIESINFQFSQSIKETVSISIFDVLGRLVYNQEKLVSENILTLDLPNLTSSNYLVKLTTSNYIYYTKILKK